MPWQILKLWSCIKTCLSCRIKSQPKAQSFAEPPRGVVFYARTVNSGKDFGHSLQDNDSAVLQPEYRIQGMDPMKDKLTDLLITLLAYAIMGIIWLYYLFIALLLQMSRGENPVLIWSVKRRFKRVLKRLPDGYRVLRVIRPTQSGFITDLNLFTVTLCSATDDRLTINNIKYQEITPENLHPAPDPEQVKLKVQQLMQQHCPDSEFRFLELSPSLNREHRLPAFDLIFLDNYQRYKVMPDVTVKDINLRTFRKWLETEAFESWFQDHYTREYGSMDPELVALARKVKDVFTAKFPQSPYQLIEVKYENSSRQQVRLFFEDQREMADSEDRQRGRKPVKEKVIPVSPITSDLFEDHWSGSYL